MLWNFIKIPFYYFNHTFNAYYFKFQTSQDGNSATRGISTTSYGRPISNDPHGLANVKKMPNLSGSIVTRFETDMPQLTVELDRKV